MGKGMGSMGRHRRMGMLAGGGIGLAAGLALRGAAGSPIPVLRLLGADALLPPLWLAGLVWLAAYALAGGAAGYLAACPVRGGSREACLWRGGTFLAVAVGISFCWYSCLFASVLLLLSWLCLLAAAGFALLCTLSWWRLNRFCALAVGAVAVWFFCLSILQAVLLLHL